MFKVIRRNYQTLRSSPITKNVAHQQMIKYLLFKLKTKIYPKRVQKVSWIENLSFKTTKYDAGIVGNVLELLQDFEDSLFMLHYLREGDTFLDIGANMGHYSLLASGVKKAFSIAVEPVPITYQKLVTNIKLNHLEDMISALPIGVSDQEDNLYFSQDHYSVNHIVDPGYNGAVQVKVKTIDSIKNAEKASIMKMDIEGFEYPALQGTKKLLASQRLQVIILELNSSGKRYGYTDKMAYDLLQGNGFAPYNYEPMERELSPLINQNQSSFNTIFIREPDLVLDRIKKSEKIKAGSFYI